MKTNRLFSSILVIIILLMLTTGMRPITPLAPLGAIINVTVFTDKYGGSDCTLRNAIQSANDNADFGGCKGTGTYGHDTILLDTGTYLLDHQNDPFTYEDANEYGDLDIEPNAIIDINIYDVTIEGNGSGNSIISGDYNDRVIDIQADAAVKLAGIEIRNGSPSIIDGKFGNGCGIYNHGTLLIEDSRLYNNICLPNGVPSGPNANGGGIWSDGKLTINNTTFDNNALNDTGNGANGGYGGGIYIAASSDDVLITNSTFISNNAGNTMDSAPSGNGGRGGAIFNAGGHTQLKTSLVVYNNAGDASSTTGNGGDGGGIYNQGSIFVTNSTFSANYAGDSISATGGSGGGLANNSGHMELHETTIVHNHTGEGIVDGYGGGLESSAVNTTTILHNTAIAMNINPGRTDPDWAPNCHTGPDVTNTLEGYYSLIEIATGCTLDINESMLLGAWFMYSNLSDNGGPTMTYALQSDSPAVDNGDPASCPVTDQRGYPRPVDGDRAGAAVCDIGAYELQLFHFLPLILRAP
jgi:hypothetical protein